MEDVSKKFIREDGSKALLNNDIKALEEYKAKKQTMRDINNMKNEINYLKSELQKVTEMYGNVLEELSYIRSKIE